MDQLFNSTYSPRHTNDLNKGNSAWHLCESEENQILMLTDGQKVDLSPRDVNQCSLTAPLITAQEHFTAHVFQALCRTA